MTNNLCGFKTSLALKKMKIIPIFGIFTALLIFRTLVPFIIPSTAFNTLNFFSSLILVWMFIERKKVVLSLDEIIIIWLLTYTALHILFAPFILIITIFITNEITTGIAVYTVMGLGVVILCQKIDLNKLLVFVLRKTIFKILIFLIALFFFIILLTLSDFRYLFEHNLIALPFIILILVGLVHTIKLIHQNTTIIPSHYHDAKKLLMLLDIKAENATDVEELKEMLAESIDLMNLELPLSDIAISNTEGTDFKLFIKHAIESIKAEKKSNTRIISNIQFSEKYREINDIKLAYMIGLLLEQALSTLTKRPIFIDITLSKDAVSMRIAYEYKFEKNQQHLETYLLDHAVIHSKVKSNFHLVKLKSLVNIHNGQITVAREKNAQDQIDYLSICLTFEKEGGGGE